MKAELVETWLQEHAGLEGKALGSGVVARAAQARIAATACGGVENYLRLLASSADWFSGRQYRTGGPQRHRITPSTSAGRTP